MAAKDIDVFEVLRRSFDWYSDPELRKLFGAFYAGNVFGIIALGVPILVIGAIVLISMFDKISPTPEYPGLTAGIIILIALGIAASMLAVGAVVYLALSRMGWTKDKGFMELAKKLALIQVVFFLVIAISVIIFVAAAVVSPVFSLLLIPILVAVGFFGTLLLTYINSFFLSGKIFELRGVKNEFTEISLDGYTKYLKFTVVRWFATMFNWMNKKILAVQIILCIITAIAIGVTLAVVFWNFGNLGDSIGYSSGAMKFLGVMVLLGFMFIPIGIYSVTIFYNGLRLYTAMPVRIVEGRGAKGAVARSWDQTRGYALNALVVTVLLMLLMGAVSMVSGIIEAMARVFIQISLVLPVLLVFSIPLYVFVFLIVNMLMSNIMLFCTVLAQIAFYQKVRENEKADKSGKKATAKK